jgi:hypothetical protein
MLRASICLRVEVLTVPVLTAAGFDAYSVLAQLLAPMTMNKKTRAFANTDAI